MIRQSGTIRLLIQYLTIASFASIMLGVVPAAMAAAEDEPKEEILEAQYLKLHPDLLVNIKGGGAQFLMVTAQVMSRGTAGVESVKRHKAAIRHHLLLLLSEQTYDTIKTVANKQELMRKALELIQKVLVEESETGEIEALFFTNFIVE